MDEKLTKLWDSRNRLVVAHRAMVTATEGREMNSEEKAEHAKRSADIKALDEQIENLREINALEASPEPEVSIDVRSGNRDARISPFRASFDDDEYRKAFTRWLRGQKLTPEQTTSLQRGFAQDAETRADYAGDAGGAAGGYAIPTTFERQVIGKVEAMPAIFDTRAQVIDTSGGGPILIPVVTANIDIVAQQENEGDAIPFGSAPLGQKQLGAHTYAGGSKVSVQLLQDSFFDIEGFISDQLGYDMGRKISTKLISGSGGTTEPEGIFTGAAVGVTTTLANAITADELLALKYSVLPQYRRQGEWLLADSTVLALRLLKDNQGRYIWAEGMTANDPDRLFGQPLHVDAFTDEVAAEAKVAAYGDFYQSFLIRRVKPFTLMKLDQLFMDHLQVGYAAWSRYDSIVKNAQAVKTLQMHA